MPEGPWGSGRGWHSLGASWWWGGSSGARWLPDGARPARVDQMALTRSRRLLCTCWRVRGLTPRDLLSHPVVIHVGNCEEVRAIKIESV